MLCYYFFRPERNADDIAELVVGHNRLPGRHDVTHLSRSLARPTSDPGENLMHANNLYANTHILAQYSIHVVTSVPKHTDFVSNTFKDFPLNIPLLFNSTPVGWSHVASPLRQSCHRGGFILLRCALTVDRNIVSIHDFVKLRLWVLEISQVVQLTYSHPKFTPLLLVLHFPNMYTYLVCPSCSLNPLNFYGKS